MPDQPPPPVAPPAAPSPSAPGADAPDKIKTEYVPALMQKLMQDVSEEEAAGDPDVGKRKPEDKKPAEPKPGDPPPPPKPGDAPPPPEVGVRKKKKERPPLPTVDDAPPPPPPPPAPRAPAAAAPDAEAARKFEEGLEENEKEMLADAKFLEEKFGDKYKGMSAKVEKFLRDHIAWTEKPDFDDQDPEYLRWVDSNMPKLSRAEIRQIEETRITESLRKDNDKQFADLHFQSFTKEKEPEIDRIGQQAYTEMTNAALPDDLSTLLRDQIKTHGPQKGYEEALKTHKLEIETAETVLMAAADDIKEFHRLNMKDPKTGRTVSEFATDPANPKFAQHQRLANMVDGVCEGFKAEAGEEAIRDGKWFVTRKEWLRLRPEARGRFWTFSNKEIIDRAKTGIKGVIAAAISQKHEYLKSRGWSRAAASASAPDAPPKSTPKAPPPPAPVPGPGGEPGGGPSATAKNLATTLNAG